MFFNISRKHVFNLLIIIFLIFISGCQLRDPSRTHGINFLENREKQLVLNISNKNDIKKILGEPHIISSVDKNKWIYVERVITKGKIYELGENVLIKNNLLELKFDQYGILLEKKLYNKDDMKKISFNENNTENNVSKESLIGGVLQSLREKMYGKNKF